MPAIQPFDRNAPFLLLDDAKRQGAGPARLYTRPFEVVVARHAHEVAPALARLEVLRQQGAALAGYAAYEAGLALEPRLAAQTQRRSGGEGPLLWFGAFAGWQEIAAPDVPAWLATQAREGRSTIGPMRPAISPGAYARGFARLKQAIADGDIYQANYTFPLSGPWQGDPLALYAMLRGRGGGAYGALIFDGDGWLLSHSPELFFTCDDQGRCGPARRPGQQHQGSRGKSDDPRSDAQRPLAHRGAGQRESARTLRHRELPQRPPNGLRDRGAPAARPLAH
jgi:para-aminobenzoate synthetase/4-amino-4-deoxychorismate lyase